MEEPGKKTALDFFCDRRRNRDSCCCHGRTMEGHFPLNKNSGRKALRKEYSSYCFAPEWKPRNSLKREMVGTGRFELPTPRTPSECSTRLSHVPTAKLSLECTRQRAAALRPSEQAEHIPWVALILHRRSTP